MNIIAEPRFGAETAIAQREQKAEFWISPLSRRPITSQGLLRNCFPKSDSFNRTETLILNISFDYIYHSSSSPKPNTIYLGIFDSTNESHSYQSVFLFLDISNADLAKEATHNTLWNLKLLYWWIIAPLPIRILNSSSLKKTITEDSYGINL